MATEQAQKEGLGGIVNMGNTCYANATLQCLRHCARVGWLLAENRCNTLFQRDPKPRRQAQQDVVESLSTVIGMLGQCSGGQSVRPGEFWRKVATSVQDTMYEHFATRAPHDSHEFYLYLLECLHEGTAQDVEMRIVRPPPTTPAEELIHQALQSWQREFSKEYSPFVDLFFGLSHAKTTCGRCGTVSHRWESFNSLKAVVPRTGEGQPTPEEMLAADFKPETIEDYHCEKCPERTTATRAVSLWRLPQMLVVVLKRFTPDGRKIHTRIAPIAGAPPTLTFQEFFSPESPERQAVTDYELRSIVDHHGSAGGGHYTAQCRNLATEKWYLYDDEGVTEMPRNQPIFGESTYVMFWERRTSPLRAPAA